MNCKTLVAALCLLVTISSLQCWAKPAHEARKRQAMMTTTMMPATMMPAGGMMGMMEGFMPTVCNIINSILSGLSTMPGLGMIIPSISMYTSKICPMATTMMPMATTTMMPMTGGK